MPQIRRALVVALILLSAACRRDTDPGRPQVIIAAAANLGDVAPVLGAQFEAETGIHAVFSFASTAQLTSQIENGAPFDLFLAADAQHVDQLDQKGLLVPGSSAVYANGILALWVPAQTESIRQMEDLVKPDVHVIAMAKPELAPYGDAAMQALHSAGIWEAVQAKIVYAENINAAKQYGTSKNADAVFTAYALVLKEGGRVIQVDEALHHPITQKLGILRASAHAPDARKFADYLLSGNGRRTLLSSGYR